MKKKKEARNYKKLAAIVASAAAVSVLGFFVYMRFLIPYEQAVKVTQTVAIKELIISAVEGLSKDAPLDYKTGDVYFPEAKLFLPAGNVTFPLIYQFSPALDGLPQELRISSKYLVNAKISALHSANGMDELFRAVPIMQSCSRGVLVQYKPFEDSQTSETVTVADGRTLYLQHETKCPELNETMQVLKNLKSY